MKLPFYSWQCISLQTKKRDIDFMIEDEFQMKMLLQFLIIRLNTHDGTPNSIKFMQDKGLFDPKKSVVDMV